MGHIRLGNLPRSKQWRDVVALLEAGAPTAEVAAQVSLAARQAFSSLQSDPMMLDAMGLLAELPLLARSPAYRESLTEFGVQDAESAPGLLAGLSDHLDRLALGRGNRSDLGEIARGAALSTLAEHLGADRPGFFEPTGTEIRATLAKLASGDQFARLGRSFFAAVASRTLDYYLSRELANHTGPGKRFADDAGRVAFDRALREHAFQAARIVEAFSGGWYGKTVWQGDGLNDDKVRRYTAYALQKLSAELRQKANAA